MDFSSMNKRQKLHDKSKFRPGFILKVKVTNFTTYSYGEFNLSPTLNMIIGPNGSGKSTLVAAICLGLGGKIDLIKRKTLKSMIKTGHNESKIEIVLKNKEDKPDLIIERIFTEKDSKWKVNNQRSDEKSVKAICRDLNIQLDNLCHFLPQERVAEFAGLSPERLLLETERTVGTGSLLHLHEDLIRNDNELVELQSKISVTEKNYNNLIQQRDRLQEEANKYKEFQSKTVELENHIMLIPYAQIQDLKVQQSHLKKERDLAKKELAKFNLNSKPLEDNLIAFNTELNSQKEIVQNLKQRLSNLFKDQEKLDIAIREKNDEKDDFFVTIAGLKSRSDRKKKELDQYVTELKKLKNQMDNIPDFDENKINSYKKNRDLKHSEMSDYKLKIEDLEFSIRPQKQTFNQLKEKLNEKKERINSNDKLALLDSRSNGSGRVNEWMENSYGAHRLLRSNPDLKGKYFEAPIISCEVTNKQYAKYIERAIDNNTLLSISFNNESFYNEISKKIFEKYNAPLRLISKTSSKSKYTKEQLQEFGFDGYLSDFITGPEEVLNMLNDVSKLNNIPVSLKPLKESQLNQLLQGDGITFPKFLSGDSFFNVHRSRYGSKQCFFTTEKIQESRFFNSVGLTEHTKSLLKREISSLSSQLQQIIAQVDVKQNEIIELKNHLKEISEEFKNLSSKLEEETKIRNLKTSLQSRINIKEQQIKKLEVESKKDFTEKIFQVEDQIKETDKKIAELLLEKAKTTNEIVENHIQLSYAMFSELQAENKVKIAESFLGNLERHKEELKEKYLAAKAKYDEIKKSDAAKKIQEQSATYTPEQRQVLGSLAAHYLETQSLTEINIREKIKLLEEERSLMSTVDQNSLESLRQKLQEIEFAEKEMPILKDQKNKLDQRISTIYQVWEPQLSELIDKISKTFQKRFVAVASDGQVELAKAERFKDWKLQILVKFRENSELKVLDHQSQSGGERAVSTIFFIMSLQGLTDAPLRVVDEINQGMDPKNEKTAHKYLVHTACNSASTSQYFLVTPKLLTGLYYHPDMVVHCIYTGSSFDDTKKLGKLNLLDFTNIAF